MQTRTNPAASAGKATLTERYVRAATRRLPEDQRVDIGEELRASIGDRVDTMRVERPDLTDEQAEYVALEELGDPDQMAAGYTGNRLQLIGPEIYPAYVRVLKAVLFTAVPAATLVVAIVDALTGASFGEVVGGAAWMAFTVALHIAFWVTLTFAIVERGSATEDMQESLGTEWTPDRLPDLPHGSRGSLSELVAGLVWLGFLGAAVIWQQFRSPIQDGSDRNGGERFPLLDPDLWSFWLPLILVLLVAEMAFEVVKYRLGRWSMRLATANTVLGAIFAAPLVYLAADDRLLNPAAVAHIQDGWAAFDPGVAHTVVLVSALGIWAWDSIDGWRKALAE